MEPASVVLWSGAMSAQETAPAPRQPVTLFICRGEEMQPFGRSRDLSLSGLFLETRDRPPLGATPDIALVWGDGTFMCKTKVMRHADDGIGLQFIDPDPAFLGAVQEILNGPDQA